MFSILAPQSSQLSACLPLSLPNDHHVIQMIEDDTFQGDTIGVVLSGPDTLKRVVLTGSLTFHHVQDQSIVLEFYATENNCLGIAVGTKCTVALQSSFDKPGLGIAIKSGHNSVLNVVLTTCDEVVCKKRSKLKHVVLPHRTLNKEESIRAYLVWLNKHNLELAPRFGMEQLVWCEETASSRSNSGVIRNFFRIDTYDNNKKKSCGNITSAIEAMQDFTKTDFYDDMLTKTVDYPGLTRAISSTGKSSLSSSGIPTLFLPKATIVKKKA